MTTPTKFIFVWLLELALQRGDHRAAWRYRAELLQTPALAWAGRGLEGGAAARPAHSGREQEQEQEQAWGALIFCPRELFEGGSCGRCGARFAGAWEFDFTHDHLCADCHAMDRAHWGISEEACA
jgi:hypothetical protein